MGSKRVKVIDEEEKKKKEAEKKTAEKKPEKKVEKKKIIEGIRGIVRIAETDLKGERKLGAALLSIRGIGNSLARGIAVAAGLDPNAMIGSLNDEQLSRLEDVIRNPIKYGIPYHMVNRKRDPFTGEDRHIVSSDLTFTVKSDIDLMKKTRTYKGKRHELGLPVRGQRTRSSFRTGVRVGVIKKKEEPAKAAEKTEKK